MREIAEKQNIYHQAILKHFKKASYKERSMFECYMNLRDRISIETRQSTHL